MLLAQASKVQYNVRPIARREFPPRLVHLSTLSTVNIKIASNYCDLGLGRVYAEYLL